MEEHIIYKKLDKMNDHLSNIRVNVGKMEICVQQNTIDLQEHVRRTNLLEKRITIVQDEVHEEIDLVKSQQNKWKGALLAVGGIFGAIGSIGYILYKLWL